MNTSLAVLGLLGLSVNTLAEGLSIPADSPRWDFQGKAKVAEYEGRQCVCVEAGGAVLKDFEFRDGVIDVDIATPAKRGFFGLQFRLDDETGNGEWVYLRQHKSGYPDAQQYTPILNGSAAWQIYNGPGFTAPLEIPLGTWMHLRLEVNGAQAKLYVQDMKEPSLVMTDLKSESQKGSIALAVLTGATYFSNFEIKETTPTKWERHPPAMAPNTLTEWNLSPVFEALERNPEKPLSRAEIDAMKWEPVKAEAPGFVVINRFREGPHINATFAKDFSKRLEPQKGSKMVYARMAIDSDKDQVKKLSIGYSDEVSIFLNGAIVYRGRSPQYFRDPGFLGIVNPENDSLYLPLKKGSNEIVLAVSEIGGGWGFNCRLEDVTN